eukprot:TRINITY_DN22207_c0_g1_i1.p1 TRINITY_DN22207_c0_g1~~TRINITY_DN22207_c0_g1_i1.p1  ORF type:complete len:584 (+),score=256.67 TRINITY_DN22207_c0_g1_i1:88-1839(+)
MGRRGDKNAVKRAAAPPAAAPAPAPTPLSQKKKANTVTFLSPQREAQVLPQRGVAGAWGQALRALRALYLLPLVPVFVIGAETFAGGDEDGALKGLAAWLCLTTLYAAYLAFILKEPVVYTTAATPAKTPLLTPHTAPHTTPASATPAPDTRLVTPESVAKQLQMSTPCSPQSILKPAATGTIVTQTTPQHTAAGGTQTTPAPPVATATGDTQTTPAPKDDRPTREELDRAATEAQFLRLDLDAACEARKAATKELAAAKQRIDELEAAATQSPAAPQAEADTEALKQQLEAKDREERRLRVRLDMALGKAGAAEDTDAAEALKQAKAQLETVQAALEGQEAAAAQAREEASVAHAKELAALQEALEAAVEANDAGKDEEEGAKAAAAAASARLEEEKKALAARVEEQAEELDAVRRKADALTGELRAVKAAADHADDPTAAWRRYNEELRRKHLALLARCEADVQEAQRKMVAKRTRHLVLADLSDAELAAVRELHQAKAAMAAAVSDAVALAQDAAAALSGFMGFADLAMDADARRALDAAVAPQLQAAADAAQGLPSLLALADGAPAQQPPATIQFPINP